MRFRTRGEIRRFDLSPVLDLVPALQSEWADLEFDRRGRLLNPVTRENEDAITLDKGRHRESGAVYWVVVSTPEWDLPEDRRDEFTTEMMELAERGAEPEEWAAHQQRRQTATVQVGVHETRLRVRLRTDDAQSVAFDLGDASESWSVAVDIVHGRLPRVRLTGRADITALLKASHAPGCLARLFGGHGEIDAMIDLTALDRGGRAVTAEGAANRFRGSTTIDIKSSTTRWPVSVRARVAARGVARPVLWFMRRRIRRGFNESLEEFWADADRTSYELAGQLAELRRATDDEGGPAPFTHRLLWDPEFDHPTW